MPKLLKLPPSVSAKLLAPVFRVELLFIVNVPSTSNPPVNVILATLLVLPMFKSLKAIVTAEVFVASRFLVPYIVTTDPVVVTGVLLV